MKDKSKWIGYIMFFITLCGWLITVGVYSNKMKGLMDGMKDMQLQMFEQQQLNGKILMYIEMDTHE